MSKKFSIPHKIFVISGSGGVFQEKIKHQRPEGKSRNLRYRRPRKVSRPWAHLLSTVQRSYFGLRHNAGENFPAGEFSSLFSFILRVP